MSDHSRFATNLPPEQEAIRAKCFHPSGTFIEFKKEEIEQSIPERFEKIARQYPGRVAVKMGECALTYDQLNQAANRIARAILEYRGEGQEPVALLLGKDAALVTAILGALKTGTFYVPLDPSFPQARIAHMLQDSQAGLVVTNSKNLSLAREFAKDARQLLNIDELDSSLSADNPGLGISADGLACIIYTSGSTGQPKGVVQTHRNVLYSIRNRTNTFHICADDRVTFLSSVSFVGAVRDIFSSLLNGAALFPFDIREERLTNLADWLSQEKLTIYASVATVFRHFVTTWTGEEKFSELRVIYAGSEPVYKEDLELYKKHFSSSCVFIHGFGTTELSPAGLCFFNKDSQVHDSVLPAGYSVDDTEILLLDGGKEVGFGQIGEIAIKSGYLSPGYWNRPDLTEAAFRLNPEGADKRIYLTGDLGRILPDGSLRHLGRKDFQVKIRGHRIEVSEIETALLTLKSVKEAVVVARDEGPTEKRLVAYIVTTEKPGPTVSTLRCALAEKLPDYMVPSTFVTLDALPLTPTGKVDRRELPVPAPTRPELNTFFVGPRTSVEKALSQIWAEVLSLKEVGVHDRFFDLGGHSLTATRVVSRVIKQFQTEVPLQVLFQSPTVADMAAVIAEHQAKKLGDHEIEAVLAELESLTDEEAKLLLAGAGETRHGRD